MTDEKVKEPVEIIEEEKTPIQKAQEARPFASYENVGRKTVVDQEVLNKLEYAFALGCSDREACFYSGISTTTLYKYQNEHKEFAERKSLLKDRPIFLARQSVLDKIPYDADLALKFLERKKKDEFSPRAELAGVKDQPLIDVADPQILKTILLTARSAQRAYEKKVNAETTDPNTAHEQEE